MNVRVEHAVRPDQWYTTWPPHPNITSLDVIEKHVHAARESASKRQLKSWFRVAFNDEIAQAAYDARHPENVVVW